MTRAAVSCVVLGGWLLAAGTARGTDAGAVGALEVELPGRVVAATVLADPAGGADLLLLVRPVAAAAAPEAAGADADADADTAAGGGAHGGVKRPCPGDGPDAEARTASLFLVGAPTRGATLLRDGLPADALWLEPFPLDATGREGIVLAREGELLGLPVRRSPDLAVGVPEVLAAEPGARWQHATGVPAVWTTGLGAMRLRGPGGAGGPWPVQQEVRLPIDARPGRHGIALASAGASWVGRRTDGTFVFATPPEPVSGRRLRSTRVDVRPGGGVETIDCWAGLPGDEDVLEHGFVLVDNAPVLVVTTKAAGTLSLFGEKRLRLFPLEADRSRLGRSPLAAFESRMNLWQPGRFAMHDVDRDGREDFVVSYFKGLADTRVVLDVYRRAPDGSFHTAARTTAFDVDGADRGYLRWGEDLDGDGTPDLLLRDATGLLLFAGAASEDGRDVVARRPRRLASGAVPVPETATVVSVGSAGIDAWYEGGAGAARVLRIDLDRDGRAELVEIDPGDATRPGRLRRLL